MVCAAVYLLLLGSRISGPTRDNHYVHLAHSYLSGQLSVVGNQPPGYNDWACFDTVLKEPCPPGKYRFPQSERDRYIWYVSFPPFPALLIAPVVAIWGLATRDALFWALIAAFGPVALFLLLRRFSDDGYSDRSLRDNLLLTGLFAFGTVFFFVAVQGTVWFAAHTVAVPLIALYLYFGLGLRRPVLAGLMLGLCFMTRPTTALLALFMAFELWRQRAQGWLRQGLLFSAPILVIGVIAMYLNHTRFEDAFEFGHQYLQIGWRGRIEKWGLFNYHYFPKHLAIFLASLPWLTRVAPYITLPRHGLALWFTTPNLLWLGWPKPPNDKARRVMIALLLSSLPVLLLNLAYQNSGWEQFGYRFSLDYLVLFFAALALGGRRFGKLFYAAAVFALVVNSFGAATFMRQWQYYDDDRSQKVIFQPD